jgi:hypothetical protein
MLDLVFMLALYVSLAYLFLIFLAFRFLSESWLSGHISISISSVKKWEIYACFAVRYSHIFHLSAFKPVGIWHRILA